MKAGSSIFSLPERLTIQEETTLKYICTEADAQAFDASERATPPEHRSVPQRCKGWG